MPPFVISLIAIVILALVFTVGSMWLRGRVYAKLERAVSSGNLDEFFRRVDSHASRALLAPYGRELLRFRALALGGDRAAMAEQFNRLMRLKLNDYERSCVLTEGFNGLAAAGDATHCRRIVEAMATAGFTTKALAAYRRHLAVALERKPEEAKGLESSYGALRGVRRGYVAYLLMRAREATGDKVAAESYRREACALYGCAASELDSRARVNTTV